MAQADAHCADVSVGGHGVIRPGLNELLVGRQAQARYRGLEIGGRLKIRNTPWIVVGVFESGGSLRESELFTD